MRCVLIGNYGVGNLGDEALKEYFLTSFPDIEWIVLSAHPRAANEVPRLPCGIRSFFTPWWRTLNAIARADAAVFGGGSLFTDAESAFASLLWGWHAFVCWVLRTPFLLAFQGIGPFSVFRSEHIAKWVVVHARHVSVRDEASYARIKSWNMNNKVVQTFDPVFATMKEYALRKTTPSVLVIIPRKNSGERFCELVRSALRERPSAIVRIVLMQREVEAGILEKLRSLVPEERCQVVSVGTLSDLLSSLGDASLVVAERYHGALAALSLSVPLRVCSRAEGDKLDMLRGHLSESSDCGPTLLSLVQNGATELHRALGLCDK